MLTREQVYTMLLLRKRGDIFSGHSNDINLIRIISDYGQDPSNDIHVALRLAASGLQHDIDRLVEMVKTDPRLLLQAGNVITRGGVEVIRTTLFEFFLGEGDPDGAKAIEFGFAELSKMKGEDGEFLDGEKERHRQYERYRPHIEALAKQIESKQPTIDVKPLIDILKLAHPADIKAALSKDMTNDSTLCLALRDFRKAIKPKRKTVGMHYDHYTTLMQAFDLLASEWNELSANDTNFDKCRVVWRQIIGILQLEGLPAVDRMGFARAFEDKIRTLNYKYGEANSFPDAPRPGDVDGVAGLTGLGFDEAIFGCSWVAARGGRGGGGGWSWKAHVEQKLRTCRTYTETAAATATTSVRVHNLLK
jgi:hypothetical protein